MRKYFLLITICIILVFQSSCSKEDKNDNASKHDLLTVTPSQTLSITPTITNIETANPDSSENMSMNSNPIDEWYLKISEQYGNSHTDGFISYLYGEAWKAELQQLLKEYNNKQLAKNYYNAVVKEENAINELVTEQEQNSDTGWGTGSSGRISMACAMVYKNAVYQLVDEYYSDFIFDSDKATKAFLNETELN